MHINSSYFIINGAARNGKAGFLWKKYESKVNTLFPNSQFIFTKHPQHAREIARKLALNKAAFTIGVGGDGTIHEIINGLFQNKEALHPSLVLGILPLGTGEDFIKNMHYPLGIEQQLTLLKKKNISYTDIGCVELTNGSRNLTKYFLNSCSIGLGANTAKIANTHKKKIGSHLSYLTSAIHSILFQKKMFISFTIDQKKELFQQYINNLSIMNGCYAGGGFHMAPKANIADGYLDLISIHDMNRLELLANLPRAYFGKHLELDKVYYKKIKSISLSSTNNVPLLLELDGEEESGMNIKVEVLTRKLPLVVP